MAHKNEIWEKDALLPDVFTDLTSATQFHEIKKQIADPALNLFVDDASMANYLSGETFVDDEHLFSTVKQKPKHTVNKDSILYQNIFEDQNDVICDGGDTDSPKSRISGKIIVVSQPKLKGDGNSKNAIAARESRQKKKQYIAGLESSIKQLTEKNEELSKRDKEQQQTIKKLQDEILYLKHVLTNESLLSRLLQNINIKEIQLSSQLSSSDETNEYSNPSGEPTVPILIDKSSKSAQTGEPSPKRVRFSTSSVATSGNNPFPTEHFTDTSRKQMKILEKAKCSSTCFAKVTCSDKIDESIGTDSVSSTSGGICLHVSGRYVSLELCSACNNSAMQTHFADHSYFKSH